MENNNNEIAVRRTIETIINEISQKKISSDEEYKKTGEWLKKVKQTQKLVDDTFEEEKKRKYREYKAVQEKIKELKKPLVQVEAVVKNLRIEWKLDQEKKLLEQKQALLEVADEEDKTDILEIFIETQPEVEGIYHVELWDFEIVDKDKIPDEYKIVDEKKIRGVVKAMKENTNIPGIRVFKKLSERVKAKMGYMKNLNFYTAGSASRGTDIHILTTVIDSGLIKREDLRDNPYATWLNAYIDFLCDNQVVIIETEKEVIDKDGLYVGHLDRVMVVNGVKTIIDIKTGGVESWCGLQLAAYGYAYDIGLNRAILQLRKDGKYRYITKLSKQELSGDYWVIMWRKVLNDYYNKWGVK